MSFPVFDILASRADLGPDRIALEDIISGDRVTYQELKMQKLQAAAQTSTWHVSTWMMKLIAGFAPAAPMASLLPMAGRKTFVSQIQTPQALDGINYFLRRQEHV